VGKEGPGFSTDTSNIYSWFRCKLYFIAYQLYFMKFQSNLINILGRECRNYAWVHDGVEN